MDGGKNLKAIIYLKVDLFFILVYCEIYLFNAKCICLMRNVLDLRLNMSTLLIISTILITCALAFYSLGVWAERIASLGIQPLVTNTLMITNGDRSRLASESLQFGSLLKQKLLSKRKGTPLLSLEE